MKCLLPNILSDWNKHIKTFFLPVADVEFYGEFFRFPPEKDYVERELTAMLQVLESHYEVKPVIYVTQRAYKAYGVTKGFTACDIDIIKWREHNNENYINILSA